MRTVLLPKIDKNKTHLIINPDGKLFNIPFEVLQEKDDFICEKYAISYTSNLGFIRHKNLTNSTNNKAHIYAPKYSKIATTAQVRNGATYLQGANDEATIISELFPSKLFNEKEISKSSFINTAYRAKILHLAMHAEVDVNHPEFSRLLFSSNLYKEEDHLYLEELYGLSLGADLAILSACNTANGFEKNGTLTSFQRAFTYAGVPATVASLWEIPDISTKKIMIDFYKNLKKGQTKSEALRNAKLTYKNEHLGTKLAAPYFWAGFVVYGDDTPVVPANNPYLIYLFLGLILAVSIGFFMLRKSKFRKRIL